jgi:ABC-2 type transport system permease protein
VVASVRTPGFFEHLRLLWGLRLTIALNQGSGHRRWLAVLGFLASSAPAIGLVLIFYRLERLSAQSSFELWPDFIVRLLCFVTSCVWVIWPVMSAGVDDHSEISRYASFPISSFRLMLASTLASVFEPRALVVYSPLVGASLAYVSERPGHFAVLNGLTLVASVLLNASLARVGLHVVLNVLRQPRSAELLGGGFVLMLVGASFIPPVDTSWLTRVKEVGVNAVPDALVANATIALGRFPTGFFAHGLLMNASGSFSGVLADALALVELTMLTLVVAWGLLLQFHRHSGRGGAQSAAARTTNPFKTTTSTFSTLVVREALDLWHNPRARLLASVPFVLGILFKLLSGRDLFVFFFGRTADAWVLGSLALYGAIVLASTFSQNAFAYDGHGFSVFLTSPLELGLVLKAKNVVHGLLACRWGCWWCSSASPLFARAP